jgi:uncharacterized protein YbjQ (UPF0145 family)
MAELIGQIVVPVILLLLGFFAGRVAERNHYKSIHEREEKFLTKPAMTTRSADDGREIQHATLAVGSVVVSVDYFKRFLSAFRLIFGGELRAYASVLDRGKREAILRMKESNPNADLYLNFRMETASISKGRGKTIGSVEVVAYSTAITYKA